MSDEDSLGSTKTHNSDDEVRHLRRRLIAQKRHMIEMEERINMMSEKLMEKSAAAVNFDTDDKDPEMIAYRTKVREMIRRPSPHHLQAIVESSEGSNSGDSSEKPLPGDKLPFLTVPDDTSDTDKKTDDDKEPIEADGIEVDADDSDDTDDTDDSEAEDDIDDSRDSGATVPAHSVASTRTRGRSPTPVRVQRVEVPVPVQQYGTSYAQAYPGVQSYYASPYQSGSYRRSVSQMPQPQPQGGVGYEQYNQEQMSQATNDWFGHNSDTIDNWKCDCQEMSYIHNKTWGSLRRKYRSVTLFVLVCSIIGETLLAAMTTMGETKEDLLAQQWLIRVNLFLNTLIVCCSGYLKVFMVVETMDVLKEYTSKVNGFLAQIISETTLPKVLRKNAVDFISQHKATYFSLLQDTPDMDEDMCEKRMEEYANLKSRKWSKAQKTDKMQSQM